MIRHNICPLCSSSDLSDFLTAKDHLVSREEFLLRRCNSCNFIFTDNIPGENEIGRYYQSEEYISHSNTARSVTDKAYQVVRKLMLTKKRRLVFRLNNKRKGKIIDYGCGTGHFLAEMKRAGWNTKGIEINSKASDFAKTVLGLEIIHPDQIGSLSHGSADIVTLWHVLEHFHEPEKQMTEVKRLIGNNGYAIVALPNPSSCDASLYRENWAAYDVPRHISHFTPETFELFAKKTGFEIISVMRLPFDVFYISILSEKIQKTSMAVIKGLIRGKLCFIGSLIRKERTSSLIYILKPL